MVTSNQKTPVTEIEAQAQMRAAKRNIAIASSGALALLVVWGATVIVVVIRMAQS